MSDVVEYVKQHVFCLDLPFKSSHACFMHCIDARISLFHHRVLDGRTWIVDRLLYLLTDPFLIGCGARMRGLHRLGAIRAIGALERHFIRSPRLERKPARLQTEFANDLERLDRAAESSRA